MHGSYRDYFNVKQGAIIADENYSPSGNAEDDDVDVKDYAPVLRNRLTRWADVIFLQYQELCNQQQASLGLLQHVFRAYIINDETREIIAQALSANSRSEAEWSDKVTFTPTPVGATSTPANKAFYALLATPNVRGVAWMLIQHKAELGLKHIDYIQVFEDDLLGTKNLYVHISPYTPPQ